MFPPPPNRTRRARQICAALGLLALSETSASALEIADYPALTALVDTMAREDGYPRAELERILGGAQVQQSIIRLMDRQSEALPWHQYRDLFINQQRIRDGVAFWQAHADALTRAADEYGVPPKVVVALIGVETHYGTRTGGHRVLDALVTLTADYPRRSAFFAGELRVFLNTARAEGIAADAVRGSFAGAIGIPQFMPSSYEAYSVDFNANGRRDLSAETEDAIGSVANYLARHGWQAGQAIFAEVTATLPESAAALVTRRAKPKLRAAQLIDAGVAFDAARASEKMALLRLRETHGDRHIVGFANFYAITRYNPSVNYAMAVVELAQKIDASRLNQ